MIIKLAPLDANFMYRAKTKTVQILNFTDVTTLKIFNSSHIHGKNVCKSVVRVMKDIANILDAQLMLLKIKGVSKYFRNCRGSCVWKYYYYFVDCHAYQEIKI